MKGKKDGQVVAYTDSIPLDNIIQSNISFLQPQMPLDSETVKSLKSAYSGTLDNTYMI